MIDDDLPTTKYGEFPVRYVESPEGFDHYN